MGNEEVRNLGRNRRFLAIFFGYFLVCYKKVTRKRIDTLRIATYSGSVWCKVSLLWDSDFVQRDPQRGSLQKLTLSRGRGPSQTPKFLSPVPPTPWLLSCWGEDSPNEKALLFEENLAAGFSHKSFVPSPHPLPIREGGVFLFIICREASPPAPRVRT